MVHRVQRRRGPDGWIKEYRHLPWPSDVTQEQKNRWFEEFTGIKLQQLKKKFGPQ